MTGIVPETSGRHDQADDISAPCHPSAGGLATGGHTSITLPVRIALLASTVLLLGSHPLLAAECQNPISALEAVYGAPPGLIAAVGYIESGLDPLRVNADGVAFHPGSVDEAERLVRRLQRAGAKYIDVGCMQIDLHHHPKAFASLRDAFDPRINVAYGAKYLADNRDRYGSWAAAVAYYHSGDPDRQAVYLSRISARYAGLDQLPRRPAPALFVEAQPAAFRAVKLSIMTVQRPLADAPGGSR